MWAGQHDVDISSPTRCYLHWPGTFFTGHGDRFFFYIIRRPERGNYKGNGVIREMDGNWGSSLSLFEYIFMSSWFIFEADGNLSVCSAALTGLTSGVLRVWAICVWLPVPLYGVVAVLVIGIFVALLFLSREVRSIIWFSERVHCYPFLWNTQKLSVRTLQNTSVRWDYGNVL